MPQSSIRLMQNQAARMSDPEIYELIKDLTPEEAFNFFCGTEEYFIESECEELAGVARRARMFGRTKCVADAKEALNKAHAKFGFGHIYSNKKSNEFAMVHPDVDQQIRITSFDEGGFIGHAELASNADIGNELWQRGYRQVAKDQHILDKIFEALAISRKSKGNPTACSNSSHVDVAH